MGICFVHILNTHNFVSFLQTCDTCGYNNEWKSQPTVKNMALGNVMMTASILFSGSMVEQALRLFDIFGVAHISRSSYFKHQSKYLEPVIINTWTAEREKILSNIKQKGGKLCLAGDSRADSPGTFTQAKM